MPPPNPWSTVRGVASAGPRTAAWVVGTARPRSRPSPSTGRPAVQLTPRLTGNVVLDELVLGAMIGVQPSATPAQLDAAGDDLRAVASLAAEQGWRDDPLSYHRDPPTLTTSEVELTSARWLRERFRWLSFESGFEPRPAEPAADRYAALATDGRAHAAVLRHREGDRPWVVCLHGFGTGTPRADFMAFRVSRLHHDLGYDVALPVLPLHGQRRAPGGPALVSYDLALSIHGLTQAVWDVRRILSWIRTETDAPVLLHGVSLGAYTAALVAALADVDGIVAGVPAVDLPELFRVHAPRAVRRRTEQVGLLDTAREAFAVVSPLAFTPRVPREQRAVYAGMGDRFVPTRQTLALWRHWDQPELRWYPGGHVGFVWSKPAAAFVQARLAAGVDAARVAARG